MRKSCNYDIIFILLFQILSRNSLDPVPHSGVLGSGLRFLAGSGTLLPHYKCILIGQGPNDEGKQLYDVKFVIKNPDGQVEGEGLLFFLGK